MTVLPRQFLSRHSPFFWGVTLYGLLTTAPSFAIATSVSPASTSPTFLLPPNFLSRSRYIPPPPRYTCPNSLEPLAILMLRDLPGYINRLQRRLPDRKQQPDEKLYTIATSPPDFEALPIGVSEYASPGDANLQQVFFTTLERQYTEQGIKEWQRFHWLFLSLSNDGWQLALLFSRQGDYPRNNQPLTPLRDASQSITALAIRAWLRDCQVGTVRPLSGQTTTQ